MIEQNPIRRAHHHHLRYQLVDGVDELLRGIGMAVGGAMVYCLALVLRTGLDYRWFGAAIFMNLLFSIAEGPLKERIRRRVTYPRIGYSSEEPGEPLTGRRKMVIALLMLPLAVAPFLGVALIITGSVPDLTTAARWGRWVPAAAGVLAAAAYWWDSARTGLQRLRTTGVMIGAAGIVASLLSSEALTAVALFFTAWGVIGGTAGAIALWRFSATRQDAATP